MNEKPLCAIAFFIISFVCFMLSACVLAMNVAPDASASFIGFSGLSGFPCGIDFAM